MQNEPMLDKFAPSRIEVVPVQYLSVKPEPPRPLVVEKAPTAQPASRSGVPASGTVWHLWGEWRPK
jgi:hypothetical protein